MKKLKLNKRGGDKVISVYWFAILILVAGGVFIMVSIFYGHPYDVRQVESELLTNKVVDCLSYGGVLNEALFKDNKVSMGFKESFLEICDITFDVEESFEDEPQYYLRVDFYKAENINDFFVPSFVAGNLNLVPGCEVQEDEGFEKMVKCNKERIYSTLDGEQYLIEVLSIVKKTEKNVK